MGREESSQARSSRARQRLVDTARELFYAEGIRAVGVDRIAAVSGVAKSTLYEHFRTKEQLVAEYLREWSLRWRAMLDQELATLEAGPVERALTVFDLLGNAVADPTFRGCPFINAAAEYPAEPVVEAPVDDHRRWVADLFTALATEARVPDPDVVGDALAQLHDGATVSAHLDGRLDAPARARRAAALILRVAPDGTRPGVPQTGVGHRGHSAPAVTTSCPASPGQGVEPTV